MDNFNVTFDIPAWIQQGLADGRYQRFGGVIRNSADGIIIAHLRETSFCINQALSGLTNAGSLTSALNLGISVIGFTLILNQLNSLNNRISLIDNSISMIKSQMEDINFKLDLTFKSELMGALNQLNKAILIDDDLLKQQLIINITCVFEKSRELFKNLSLKLIEDGIWEYEELLAIYEVYTFLYLAHTSLSICYLEMQQLDMSKEILREGIYKLKEIYKEILLMDDEEDNEEEKINEFISILEYGMAESLLIHPSSLIELLFVGYKLREDHEYLEKKNQEKIRHAKQVLQKSKDIFLIVESFLKEIEYLEKLGLNWSEWKKLKPAENNPKAEFMCIIPSAT